MTPAAGPQLRDIHLPPEPSWFPPAPGWWLLALITLLFIAWLLYRAHARRERRRARQRLLAEFDRIASPVDDPAAAAAQLGALSMLLRRACRRHAPQALPLQGQAWLEFLDGENAERPFSAGAGRLLLDGPYRARVEPADVARFTPLLRQRLLQLQASSP